MIIWELKAFSNIYRLWALHRLLRVMHHRQQLRLTPQPKPSARPREDPLSPECYSQVVWW